MMNKVNDLEPPNEETAIDDSEQEATTENLETGEEFRGDSWKKNSEQRDAMNFSMGLSALFFPRIEREESKSSRRRGERRKYLGQFLENDINNVRVSIV